MAGTKSTQEQDKDVVSRLADAGEDALRRLLELPHRVIVEMRDEVGERLQDVATKLRAIDPLESRVGAIERRLDSLEQPKKTTARTASTRPTPSSARKPSQAPTLEPEHRAEDEGKPAP